MTNIKFNKLISLFVATLILIGVCFSAFAASQTAPDLTQKGSVSVTLSDKETGSPISGKKFRLYLVAEAHFSGDSLAFKYVSAFANNGMNLDDRYATYLPSHLAYYAERMSLPHEEKYTKADGTVTFTELSAGLYLVVPVDVDSLPFLVSIPENIDSKWEYDLDASPKIKGDIEDDTPDKDITVEKKWKGESHPNSVVVALLKDGKEYTSEILTAQTGWKFTWTNLDANHSWTVLEKDVPDGFEVSYELVGKKTVITNTKEEPEETTTSPEESTTSPDETTNPTSPEETTAPDGTTNPGEDSTTEPGEGTTVPDGDKTTKPQGTTQPTTKGETTTKEQLADTGQLNWPVPVFAVVGLLLFSTGWAMLNLKKEEQE